MPQVYFNESLKRYIFNSPGMEDMQEMASLRWHYQNGVWSTPSHYLASPMWSHVGAEDHVTRKHLGPYAWNYQASFARKPLDGTGIDTIYFPQSDINIPMDFQIAGVQLAARQQATLIADEPGLGKTAQSIGVANIRKPKRVLIGCPTFLTLNWADELVKWCTYPMPITVLNRPRKFIPEEGFVILPYSRAMSYWERLIASGQWGLSILDEIHYLKGDAGTARIKPFFGEDQKLAIDAVPGMAPVHTGERYPGVVQKSDQVIGLTGTPIPNAPHELFNVMRWFRPDIMGGMTRNKFKDTYCTQFTPTSGKMQGRDMITGAQYELALNTELRASGLMVRRQKKDVLTQLPPKVMNVVQLPATGKLADLVQEEANYYDMLLMKMYHGQKLSDIIGHIAQVRAEIGFLKAPSIAEYAWSLIEGGQKRLVIFMWHKRAINRIIEILHQKSNQVRVHRLDGSTPVSERFARVKEFQNDDDMPQIIVGQIKAAGVGLTMTKASNVILGELSWSPADNEQAIDRIHRISQLLQVTAHILTYPHSVDVKVIKTNARKAILAANILDRNIMEEFEKLEGVVELNT